MTKIERIARAYWQAEESRDIDAILAFFAEDASWNGPGNALRGIAEIRTFYEASILRFPSLTVNAGRAFGDECEASIEWSATFRDHAGEAYALDGVNIMRISGNKIVSLTTYNDPGRFQRAAAPATYMAFADRFRDRRILVTGAASGIGEAAARLFLAEGALVTGVDRDEDALDRLGHSLGDSAERFTPFRADLNDASAIKEIVAAGAGKNNVLDVLINNAAVFRLAGIDASEADWQETLAVNLIAPAQLTAAATDALARGTRPSIVNVASISGHVSQANRWTYNASKGGVLSLTRCQALDLAPKGIRVNSVSPGYIWTNVLYRGAGGDRARWDPIWGGYCPLDRCGEAHEVASGIAFLASDAASFITGSDLLIDGGLTSMSPDGRSAYEFSS